MAGVAFSKLSNADNVGYIIPWIIVQHFRAEYETHGSFRGCCSGVFLSKTCQSCAALLRLCSSTFVTTPYAEYLPSSWVRLSLLSGVHFPVLKHLKHHGVLVSIDLSDFSVSSLVQQRDAVKARPCSSSFAACLRSWLSVAGHGEQPPAAVLSGKCCANCGHCITTAACSPKREM